MYLRKICQHLASSCELLKGFNLAFCTRTIAPETPLIVIHKLTPAAFARVNTFVCPGSKPAFTCSKAATEIPEQCVKSAQS